MTEQHVFPIAELRDLILRFASRPDIRSISCCFTDCDLWKGLLGEQVRRATAQGIPPREALCLMGPDSGIPGVNLLWDCLHILDVESGEEHERLRREFLEQDTSLERRMGGDIHIPCEGMCGGDFLVLPHWRTVAPERWQSPGAHLSYAIGKSCNFLLAERDLGESPCATRSEPVPGWWLYESTNPLPDCNPFHLP
jgi:hypothetical protein